MASLSKTEQLTNKDITIASVIVDGVRIDVYGIPHGCGTRIDNKNLLEIQRVVSLDIPVYFDSDIGSRLSKSENIAYDWLAMSPFESVRYGFISVVHPALILSRSREFLQRLFTGTVNKESLCSSLVGVSSEDLENRIIELPTLHAENHNSIPVWLRVLSKYVNYPILSIYLTEYVVYKARMNGDRHVSLICSESIVRIVQWYASIYNEPEHWVCSHSEECKNAIHNTIENKYYFRYRRQVYKLFRRTGKLSAYLLYLLPLIYILA